MSELDLSPEARRRLWQCYSLLLRLAEEADEDTLEGCMVYSYGDRYDFKWMREITE